MAITLFSATLSLAHPGFNFGWGGHGGGGIFGGSFGLFPEYYRFSCPHANHIVLSVLEKAIAKEPRMAASLLRLHFHDCFVQVLDIYNIYENNNNNRKDFETLAYKWLLINCMHA